MKSLSFYYLLLFAVPFSVRAEEPRRAGPDWWSLQKITKTEPPKVRKVGLATNPIDAFILAKLEAKGIPLAPSADPITLIRRVTFDLTGLPPTPAAIDLFLERSSAKPQAAYEELVDRLLASPHYGERWGRHWLDAVRFAESHGFEYDRIRDNAWRYRDYVIKSFNDDKPYSEFVKEQIAGDVLPTSSRDGLIATGFLVAGPWDQAGAGASSLSIRTKVREDELEEMLGTVGQTFLGLTINCARCHDHKFDPLSARDYYRMKAIFDGVYHGDRLLFAPAELKTRQEEIAKHQARIEELQRRIVEIEKRGRAKVTRKEEAKDLPRPISRWTFEGDARDPIGNLHGTLQGGATIAGGRLILDGKGAFVETATLEHDLSEKTLEAWVLLANIDQRGGGVISVETNNGGSFDAIVIGEKAPGKWIAGSNGFTRTRELVGGTEKPGELAHIAIAYSTDGRISLYRNGEPYGESYVPMSKLLTFKARESRILFGKRHTGGGNALLTGAIEEARLYDRALSVEEIRGSFKAGVDRVSHQQLLMALSEEDRREFAKLEVDLTALRAKLPAAPTGVMTYAATIKTPGSTHLLKRGDPELKVEVVTAAPPVAVKGPVAFDMKEDAAEGERRLKFAEWVAHPDNPLTWRVMANRIWQHHLGEGIVRSPNDFGFNGERPTQPELLDWLAFALRENGGSAKKLHRLILLSSTYRQASTFNATAAELDSENRLLWRFAPRRLEAEAVRDAMLAISGQLNPQVGGPGYRPFKIESFNSAFYNLIDVDTPDFNRRSVYRINVNSAKDPLLDVLDCPDPSVKTPRRLTTTTPLQALTLMNNSFVQRQSRVFAERIKKEAGDDVNAQIALAYRYALARKPTPAELERMAVVVKENGLRAACWAFLNSSEFVYTR